MRTIPYGHQHIDDEDVRCVADALRAEYLTSGPKVAEFERALASYVGAKHAVAVNSGTSALDIAVAALELPHGSEIITTPFSFVATANCILYNNCKPVFADIDRRTYNIDPAQVKRLITKKTRAVIYVDYAGQPCEINELSEIAEKHDLFTIEDACHALGAEYAGKKIGSFADMTVFSFHPVKHITTGEGGAVTTQNGEFYEKLKLLRNHGIDKTPVERAGYLYDMKMLGRNYRITDFQCSLGISQLAKIEKFLKLREKVVRRYDAELAGVKEIETPYVMPSIRHAWHLYTILAGRKSKRDRFFSAMRAKGIGVNVHYMPVYSFSYYRKLGVPHRCPNADDISSRIITLPLFAGITDEEVKHVIDAVKKTAEELA